jgi:hypothetical protein
MAARRLPRETSPIRIDTAARERLDVLKAQLEPQGLPEYVKLTDAVSALALFATPQQLAWSLASYYRATPELLIGDTVPPDDEVKSS